MVEDFINNIVEQQLKNLDDATIKFLRENGYEIPEVITNEYLDNLRKELAKEDKFIDVMQWIDYDFVNNNATHHIIPFFNILSNPLSEDDKNEIIERYKNDKNK